MWCRFAKGSEMEYTECDARVAELTRLPVKMSWTLIVASGALMASPEAILYGEAGLPLPPDRSSPFPACA